MKKYFRDTSNFLSFALALIPAFLLYVFQPLRDVPYIVFIAVLFLALLFAWLAIKMRLDLRNIKPKSSLSLISCMHGRCLCWPNGLIVHDSIVSFYQKHDDLERPIGYGYVETINEKGIAQIVPQASSQDASKALYEQIASNASVVVVRPTITRDTLASLKSLF